MFAGDAIVIFQVGDAARDLEHAMVGVRRQVEAADRLLQQRKIWLAGWPGVQRHLPL